MKIIRNLEEVFFNRTIVTLGKFDGNHIGHQLLFDTAIRLKNEKNNINNNEKHSVVIFTFDVPVSKVVKNENTNTIITAEELTYQKYSDGIDYLVVFPFNEITRNMSPEAFISDILVNKLHVCTIVVGEDFCFGKDRAGNVDTLIRLGEKLDFDVLAVQKVMYKPSDYSVPQEVSSTLIKEEILKGNLKDANNMLGHPFEVTGKVVHGKKIGGAIGFPTLNIESYQGKILPPNGVYATRTKLDGQFFEGITNIGTRPTFDDGEERTVENHLFDFSGDAYGKIVEVQFLEFIRTEKKFNSVEELSEEIKENINTVKVFFEGLQ